MSEWMAPAASCARVPARDRPGPHLVLADREERDQARGARSSRAARGVIAGSVSPRSARNAACSSPASWATSASITADTQPSRVSGRAPRASPRPKVSASVPRPVDLLLGEVQAVEDRLLREEREARGSRLASSSESGKARIGVSASSAGLSRTQDRLLADVGIGPLLLDRRLEPLEPPLDDLEIGEDQLGLEVDDVARAASRRVRRRRRETRAPRGGARRRSGTPWPRGPAARPSRSPRGPPPRTVAYVVFFGLKSAVRRSTRSSGTRATPVCISPRDAPNDEVATLLPGEQVEQRGLAAPGEPDESDLHGGLMLTCRAMAVTRRRDGALGLPRAPSAGCASPSLTHSARSTAKARSSPCSSPRCGAATRSRSRSASPTSRRFASPGCGSRSAASPSSSTRGGPATRVSPSVPASGAGDLVARPPLHRPDRAHEPGPRRSPPRPTARVLVNSYAIHTVVLAHFFIPGDRLSAGQDRRHPRRLRRDRDPVRPRLLVRERHPPRRPRRDGAARSCSASAPSTWRAPSSGSTR